MSVSKRIALDGSQLQPGKKKRLLSAMMTPVGCSLSPAKRIAIDGMLAAVYFALSFLTFYIGPNALKITFVSLAFMVAALLFGPLDAMAVALVGEFLYQLIIYGLTITTPIWLIPPVIFALRLGVFAILMGTKEKPLVTRPVACAIACMDCGFVNSIFNTAALYVDSKIWGYYEFKLIFTLGLYRIVIAIVVAAALCALVVPIVKALRKRIPALAAK